MPEPFPWGSLAIVLLAVVGLAYLLHAPFTSAARRRQRFDERMSRRRREYR